MKRIVLIALWFCAAQGYAQKLSKADKKIMTSLQTNLSYLASDQLEGRRTGTKGEELAYTYISQEFSKAGISARGTNNFLQPFEVNDGKAVNSSSHFFINGHDLVLDKEYFPLAFSANGAADDLLESLEVPGKQVLCWDLKGVLSENSNNPHFDLAGAIIEKANAGLARALILYNTSAIKDDLKFDPKSKQPTVKIPVVYLTPQTVKNYAGGSLDVKLKLQLEDKKRTGHNVVGYIDNKASHTIVIGAHYDHLGYGEDHNSLYSGKSPQVHNGADDNASGTSAMIELARLLKKSGSKKSNYLFIAFSGEELGLYGSKFFVENPTINLSDVNYMINMDMVGRLNDSTRGLSIGGYGTSPTWGKLIREQDSYFKIKFDSSGTGPSDHTSFYRKDIPVLFFFTGTHADYHKPSDDADKVNYYGQLQIVKYIFNLVDKTAAEPKLAFTKTREAATAAKTSFKVSLGIMPDYTFSGAGVRADGVSEGRAAQKAGIKAGDIVTAIGNHKCPDVQAYMTALSKFNKGDAVKVYVTRGTEQLVFDIVF